jgi:hypothetical protein
MRHGSLCQPLIVGTHGPKSSPNVLLLTVSRSQSQLDEYKSPISLSTLSSFPDDRPLQQLLRHLPAQHHTLNAMVAQHHRTDGVGRGRYQPDVDRLRRPDGFLFVGNISRTTLVILGLHLHARVTLATGRWALDDSRAPFYGFFGRMNQGIEPSWIRCKQPPTTAAICGATRRRAQGMAWPAPHDKPSILSHVGAPFVHTTNLERDPFCPTSEQLQQIRRRGH